MYLFSILFIAFGLAMDAFAVSITKGLTIKNLKVKDAFVIALFFGMFQAFMPILGWLAGVGLNEIISSIDHWVAFILLSAIGCKMIYESTKIEKNQNQDKSITLSILLVLSIATSIDALAVGVSFALLTIPILLPSIIIGFVTFSLSFIGVYIGNRKGHFFEGKIEIIGGIILILIGLKILIEHML